MAAVDGFGWVQGNGRGISQRGRFNASAVAEADAWKTVNFVRGFVSFVGLRDLFFTNSLELVLCLKREAV
jgi:hypothetical protein